MTVLLGHHLRVQRRFDDIASLVVQLSVDVAACRARCVSLLEQFVGSLPLWLARTRQPVATVVLPDRWAVGSVGSYRDQPDRVFACPLTMTESWRSPAAR